MVNIFSFLPQVFLKIEVSGQIRWRTPVSQRIDGRLEYNGGVCRLQKVHLRNHQLKPAQPGVGQQKSPVEKEDTVFLHVLSGPLGVLPLRKDYQWDLSPVPSLCVCVQGSLGAAMLQDSSQGFSLAGSIRNRSGLCYTLWHRRKAVFISVDGTRQVSQLFICTQKA